MKGLKAEFCLIFNVENLPKENRSKLQLTWDQNVLHCREKNEKSENLPPSQVLAIPLLKLVNSSSLVLESIILTSPLHQNVKLVTKHIKIK